MDKSPKRRKYNDNPYTLRIEDNKYFISFKDNKKILQTIEVSSNIFKVFNDSELHDLSELNEYDRHIEHSEIYEGSLYSKTINDYYSLERDVENRLLINELKEAIGKLPEIQKKRIIKYFFDGKTYEEIAREEHCSKVAIKYSIDLAIEKISKKIKN